MSKIMIFSDICEMKMVIGDETITLNEMQSNFEELINEYEMDGNVLMGISFVNRKKLLDAYKI